jgi:hypothetical protein
VVKVKNHIAGLDRPWGFQEAEAPRFQDNRYMRVVRLWDLRTCRLYPPWNIPGTHFCQRLSQSQGHIAAGRMSIKIPGKLTWIEPATFRLVAQCLNQERHRVPRLLWTWHKSSPHIQAVPFGYFLILSSKFSKIIIPSGFRSKCWYETSNWILGYLACTTFYCRKHNFKWTAIAQSV